MPESYTGTEGTIAFNAGMTIMDGTEDRRDGWLAINRTRDSIATLQSDVTTFNNSLVGSGAGLRTSTPHTTSPSAYTPLVISWNIEDFDTANYHSSGQPTRLTAPVAGLYQVTAKVRTSSTTLASGLQFGVNGTIDASSRVITQEISTAGAFTTLTKVYSLTSGQYVEVFSLGEAANLTLDIAECFVQMIRIR